MRIGQIVSSLTNKMKVSSDERVSKKEARETDTPKVRLNPQVRQLTDYGFFLEQSKSVSLENSQSSSKYDYMNDLKSRIGSVTQFFIGSWLKRSQDDVYNQLKQAGYVVTQNKNIDDSF